MPLVSSSPGPFSASGRRGNVTSDLRAKIDIQNDIKCNSLDCVWVGPLCRFFFIIFTAMKSKLVILLFTLTCLCAVLFMRPWLKDNYTSDALGYYLYLPTIFIYHDLDALKLENRQQYAHIKRETNPYDAAKTEWSFDKFTLGTALSELPFFLIAYGITDNVTGFSPDGYGIPYQLAGIFSTIFWVVMGLFVMRKFLRLYFSDAIVAITLCCIALGTNLFCYSAFNFGMSHTYLFFLYACVLLFTQRFYGAPSARKASVLGLLSGLIVITRPTAILIFPLLVLFWEVGTVASLRGRLAFFGANLGPIAVGVFSFVLVALIQCSYWKYTTHQWIYYSYTQEGFDFLKPNIINGLFSFRKGWLVYTPMVIPAFIGLFMMRRRNPALFPIFVLYFVVIIYVVFSWRCWWYGGSFSARALVESLAPLALPLGYFIKYAIDSAGKTVRYSVACLLTFFVLLNVFQSYQYSIGVIHYDRMSWAYYWKVLGKTKADPADERYLMDEKEYWRELNATVQ